MENPSLILLISLPQFFLSSLSSISWLDFNHLEVQCNIRFEHLNELFWNVIWGFCFCFSVPFCRALRIFYTLDGYQAVFTFTLISIFANFNLLFEFDFIDFGGKNRQIRKSSNGIGDVPWHFCVFRGIIYATRRPKMSSHGIFKTTFGMKFESCKMLEVWFPAQNSI